MEGLQGLWGLPSLCLLNLMPQPDAELEVAASFKSSTLNATAEPLNPETPKRKPTLNLKP